MITLFDGSMQRIAENDDGYPRASPDSELIVRLPATGTYYLLVQEWTTWSDEPAEGGASFEYELTVDETDGGLRRGHHRRRGAATTLRASVQGAARGRFYVVAGLLEDATDVDVYSVRFPPGGQYDSRCSSSRRATTGNGSTCGARPPSRWRTPTGPRSSRG
ncbi:MAG: hypothetical protein M5U28_28810 [Sandaracinaceae bacterium]|nr:hypothetical protein [Sandaracinaceae bacterium]